MKFCYKKKINFWKNKKFEYFIDNKIMLVVLNVLTLGVYSLTTFLIRKKRTIKKVKQDPIEKSSKKQNLNFEKNIQKPISKERWTKQKIYFYYFAAISYNCFHNFLSLITFFPFFLFKKNKNDLLSFNFLNNEKKNIEQKNTNDTNENKDSKSILILDEVNDFNIDGAIKNNINGNLKKTNNQKKDPFIVFLFLCTMCLFGILSCGTFFIYVAIKKYYYKEKYEFMNKFFKTSIIDQCFFDEQIRKLNNNFQQEISFENSYAENLLTDTNKSKISSYENIFQTSLFNEKIKKFFTILFLTFFTFGLFPVFVFYKWTRNESKLYKIYPQHAKEKVNFNFLKKSFFRRSIIYDFGFDLKLATAISTEKILNITTNYDFSAKTTKDFNILFIRIITSPIFKWLFTLFLFLINYSFLTVWWIFFGFQTTSIIFIFFMVFLVFLLFSISYHIFLLF